MFQGLSTERLEKIRDGVKESQWGAIQLGIFFLTMFAAHIIMPDRASLVAESFSNVHDWIPAASGVVAVLVSSFIRPQARKK